MINIAYVIDTIESPHAGTEHQLLQMIARLNRDEFTPCLVALRPSEWLAGADLGCETLVLDQQSFNNIGTWRQQRRFISFCRERNIDIVQSFFRDSNIAGTIWGRMARVPVIISSRRNIGSGYWHSLKEVAMLKVLRRFTTRWLANSQAAANEAIEVEGAEPDRVAVIHNGIDVSRFAEPTAEVRREIRDQWGVGPEAVVVGAVANLRPIKNLPFLIEAAALLCGKHDHLRFVVLGEGPQRAELQSAIDRHGLTDRFLLPGRSTSVDLDLYGFDIAVLCSKGESLSNSLMEYCAAARPAVASDVGGNREIIGSPELGLTYPPGDLAAFERAIKQYLGDPQRAAAIGHRARQSLVERFSWDVVIGRLQNIYRDLVNRRVSIPDNNSVQ